MLRQHIWWGLPGRRAGTIWAYRVFPRGGQPGELPICIGPSIHGKGRPGEVLDINPALVGRE